MLYEFALTPGIFDPQAVTSNSAVARDLILFLDGLRDNGLVGDLCDGELRREIGRKLAAFPSGPLREQLRFYFELMDKRQRFVTRAYIGPGWPGDELTWFDEALRS